MTNAEQFSGFSATYVYVRSRQLEGTYSHDPSIGMWGISACRVSRGWATLHGTSFPFRTVGRLPNYPV